MDNQEDVNQEQKQILPFPIQCVMTPDSSKITADISLEWIVQSGSDGPFYSEAFPQSTKLQFRIKIMYIRRSRVLQFFITRWNPVCQDDDTEIMYKVNVDAIFPGNASVSPVSSKKEISAFQKYNEWTHSCIALSSNCDYTLLKFVISSISVVRKGPTGRELKPLTWLLDNDADESMVKLVGEDLSEVEVLQCTLQCSSEVFAKMLEGDWKESKEKSVTLQGLDGKALHEFKRYLYANAPPRSRAKQLFALANMYDMDNLRFSCAEVLYAQLTPDNAMEILSIAALHKYVPLIKAVNLYFEEHGYGI